MRALDRLAKTSYGAYRLIGQLELRVRDLRAGDPPPFLVYQMGKVGSSSVLRSLNAIDLPRQIHHVHTLSPKDIAVAERVYRDRFPIRRQIDTHLLSSLYLRRKIDSGGNDQRWTVVTLVRDPVARNVSSFFEVLDLEYVDLHEALTASHDSREDLTSLLIDAFFDRFPHEHALRWFDEELRAVLGFNVYSFDFPHETGYAVLRTEDLDLLVIRLEDLDQCGHEAFDEFLGIQDFSLLKANQSGSKDYFDAYRRVLDAISFPDEYLERMYASEYARHFYTAEEIDAFRRYWTSGGGDREFRSDDDSKSKGV